MCYAFMLMPVYCGPLSSKPVAMFVSDVVVFNLIRMRPLSECNLIIHNENSVRQCFAIELVGLTY